MCKAGGLQLWLKCVAVCSFFGERLLELLRSSKPRRESLQEKVFAALETGWKGKGKESFCPGNRVESMAAKRGRGGARHTPKPFTDEGVLFKVLGDHKELVKDLGPYELISRSGAVDPKGLVRNLDLVRDLLRAEPTGEVHTQPMRQALLKLMRNDPTVNTSRFNGSAWSNLKGERLGCLLNHTRKWARAELEGKSNAASNGKLKELLDLFEEKEVPETGTSAGPGRQEAAFERRQAFAAQAFPGLGRFPENVRGKPGKQP